MVPGEFIPHNAIDKLGDERLVQESGIGDLDLVLGFNNHEGGVVTMGEHALGMTLEELQTWPAMEKMLDTCLMYIGANKNKVVKKVRFFDLRKKS